MVGPLVVTCLDVKLKNHGDTTARRDMNIFYLCRPIGKGERVRQEDKGQGDKEQGDKGQGDR